MGQSSFTKAEIKQNALDSLKYDIETSQFIGHHTNKVLYYSFRSSRMHYKAFMRFFVVGQNGIKNVTLNIAKAFNYSVNDSGEMKCQDECNLAWLISEKLFGEPNKIDTVDMNY